MRRIIALLDKDTEYVSRLADFFNSKEPALKAVAFSGESYIPDRKYEAEMVVTFSEDRVAPMGNRTVNVFKYQPAEKIYRYVMQMYEERGENNLAPVKTGKCRITTIYSPVNRTGKTTFAVTLALYKAQSARTLLVSLDEYAGAFRYIAAEANSDLSDAIYAFRRGDFSWAKVETVSYDFGTLKYIPPVRYAEDLLALNAEEMCALIREIGVQGSFENVVVDAGSYGKRVAELLEISDEILMPVRSSKVSGCKKDEFYEMLDASGHGDVAGRIRECKLPYDKRFGELMTLPADYMKGELWDYAGGIVQGDS